MSRLNPGKRIGLFVLVVAALVSGLIALYLPVRTAAAASAGKVSVFVRFEVGNPASSIVVLDSHLPTTDAERLLRTEAAYMISTSVLDAAASELSTVTKALVKADDLRPRVKAEPVAGTYYIDLTVGGATVDDATDVATIVAASYQDARAYRRGKMVRDRIEAMERIRKGLRTDFEALSQRKEALLARSELVLPEIMHEPPPAVVARLAMEKIAELRPLYNMEVRDNPDLTEKLRLEGLLEYHTTDLMRAEQRLREASLCIARIRDLDAERDRKLDRLTVIEQRLDELYATNMSADAVYPSIRLVEKAHPR